MGWNIPEKPSKLLIVTEQGIEIPCSLKYIQPLRDLGLDVTICAEDKIHGLIIESGIDSSQ